MERTVRRASYWLRVHAFLPMSRRAWLPVGAVVSYVAGAALVWAPGDIGGVGALLLLAANGGAMALDWHAYRTLGGRVRWHRVGGWVRAGLVVLYLLLAVAPLFVALPELRGAWQRRRAMLEARQAHIARLERDLEL